MSEAVGDFSIDADELDAVIADVAKTQQQLASLTQDVEQEVAALQSVWEGLAAQAQTEAQAEWRQGMLDMREALEALRAAARTAHSNYTGAADSNVTMWQQLR